MDDLQYFIWPNWWPNLVSPQFSPIEIWKIKMRKETQKNTHIFPSPLRTPPKMFPSRWIHGVITFINGRKYMGKVNEARKPYLEGWFHSINIWWLWPTNRTAGFRVLVRSTSNHLRYFVNSDDGISSWQDPRIDAQWPQNWTGQKRWVVVGDGRCFILLLLSLKGTWVLVWKVFFWGLSVLGGWVRQGGWLTSHEFSIFFQTFSNASKSRKSK